MVRKFSPSEMQDRIIVRLPDGMRDQLAELAKSNNRSVNAEVVSCLQGLLSETAPLTSKGIAAQDLSATVANLRDQISKQSHQMSRQMHQMSELSLQLSNLMESIKASVSPHPGKSLAD